MESPAAAKFCHLHVHSEYSLLDGSINIKALIKEVKQRGHSHIALTDHGNMHGAVDFYFGAKNAGLIPIIGSEIYHEPLSGYGAGDGQVCHLVLLAQNYNGYQNLMKIVSSGYQGDNFQEVPLVSAEVLQRYSGDICALSACNRGEFAYLLRDLRDGQRQLEFKGNKYEALGNYVAIMQELFGDDFYIELIDNGLVEQKEILPDLIAAAEHFALPLLASADAHYLHANFASIHNVILAIKHKLTLRDMEQQQQGTDFHLRTDAEMANLFASCPEALANTMVVAEKCSGLEIPTGVYHMPKINLGGEKPEDSFQRLAKEGLAQRVQEMKQYHGRVLSSEEEGVYRKRLDYEIGVILKMGFADYFLIVQDFINWAKGQKIPVGPGRGSGAGSLVAFSLRITDLDPLPYNLIFERFLNPERVSMPDFDVDFCQNRRDEVIQYCVDKYGSAHIAQITTFGKMHAKASVKNVGRVMGVSYSRTDRITKLFPKEAETIADAVEQEKEIRAEMEKDSEIADCIKIAKQVEGQLSHSSVHAAGLVISDGVMTDYVPTYTTDGSTSITQYEMKPVEKVGLVKFDFLGLKTLTVISQAADFVRERYDKDFNIDHLPLDDPKVYELLTAGQTVGVFQCEGDGITNFITKFKPHNFEDLIASIAIYRPGPLGSGQVASMIARKNGEEEIEYEHPSLEPILGDTYGLIIYQEQVQKIAADLASYSLGEADLLRRAMGKKIPEEMDKQRSRFLDGAEKNGFDKELALQIFEQMAEFAHYGFNKSHSAAYGLVSFQTAYLKAYYPAEFFAASMNFDMDNNDKLALLMADCKRLGIEILPPSLNRSKVNFYVLGEKQIDYALGAIKGMNLAVHPILEARESGGPFLDLLDLAKRVDLSKVGKKSLQTLNEACAFDFFGYQRRDLAQVLDKVFKYSVDYHEKQSRGQVSLFDFSATQFNTEVKEDLPWLNLPEVERCWEWEDLFAEHRLLGMFFSAHPISFFSFERKILALKSVSDLLAIYREIPPVKPGEDGDKKGKKNARREVTILAYLSFSKRRRIKGGKLLLTVGLQDDFYIEGAMFNYTEDKFEVPPNQVPVIASGYVERTKNDDLRFGLSNLEALEARRLEVIGLVVLTLKVDLKDTGSQIWRKFHGKLRDLCIKHRGTTPLVFRLRFNNKSSVVIKLAKWPILPHNVFFVDLKMQLPKSLQPSIYYRMNKS